MSKPTPIKINFRDNENHTTIWDSEDFSKTIGRNIIFKQDNSSCSKKGTIRGMHLQVSPFQEKLIWCSQGAIYDVAVCVDKQSEDFGKIFDIYLDETSKQGFWIPGGYAHGFQALKDETVICYKCTSYYAPKQERAFHALDKKIGIQWPLKDFLLSEKDQQNPYFDKTGKNYQ